MESTNPSDNKHVKLDEQSKTKKKRPRLGRITDINKKLRATTHELGPSCECKRFKCFQEITETERRSVIREFNELGTYDDQNEYLGKLITVHKVSRTRLRKPENNPKCHSHSYSYRIRLRRSGKFAVDVPVCFKAFRSIHGITNRRIQTLQSHLVQYGGIQKDKRGKHSTRPQRLASDVIEHVHGHIKSLKSRKSQCNLMVSNKLYLSKELNVAKLFKMFKHLYPNDKISYESYRTIFNTQNNVNFFRLPKMSDTLQY